MPVAIGIILVCNCGNHRPTPSPSAPVGYPFHLVIRATVDGADLLYDSVYHSSASRAFTVTDFRYYLSNITAIRDDDTGLDLSCSAMLVEPQKREYDPGRLPAGSYKALRFTLGLDSAVNHGDPTLFAAGHPLSIQTPSMHWDWNSGYIFMKLEGMADTTKTGRGAPITKFFYHIGMDRMKRVITVQTRFSIGSSSKNSVPLKFDIAEIFAVIDLKSETATHTIDNEPLAGRMADSWQQAFSTER